MDYLGFILIFLGSTLTLVKTEDTVRVNGIFDFIMQNNQQSRDLQENFSNITIPNLVKKYEVDLVFTTISASLRASQGTLSDLTTLHRIGEVTMEARGNTAIFEAAVSLSKLQVVFRHYTLQAALITKSGNMLAVDVRRNAFDAKVVAHLNGPTCEVMLEKLKIKQFGDVKVELTGFSILNPIINKIADWFVDFFNGFVVEIAETYAKKMVNHVVQDPEVCGRIFGNAVIGIPQVINIPQVPKVSRK